MLYWREGVEFVLKSYLNHLIEGNIMDGAVFKFTFFGIYAWAKGQNKFKMWNLMRGRARDPTVSTIVGGHFNEIL